MPRIIYHLFLLGGLVMGINKAMAEESLTPSASPLAAFNAEKSSDIGDNTAKDDRQIYYLYNNIDLVTTLKYTYYKPRIVIKAVYPLLHAEEMDEASDTFNTLVLAMVKLESDSFKKRVDELKSVQDQLPKTSLRNDFFIDYDSAFVHSEDQHLLSIRFTMAGNIAGQAHPFHYHRVLNYDLDDGMALELSDLFSPGTDYLRRLADYARTALTKRLPVKDMIAKGTEPTLENFRIWNLKPHGLVITFEEAQVAPYVYGAQTVVIPYSVIKDLLDPDSPIIDCVQERKHCLRNNLITGGFMDEA